MTTQADNTRRVLGMSLDGPASPVLPSDFPFGDSTTHTMMNIEPVKMRRDDVYKWSGRYRVVSSVIEQSSGAIVVYFRELDNGELKPAIIPEGVLAITVFRPKDSYL